MPFDPRYAVFRTLEDVLQRGQTLDQAETAHVPAAAESRDRGFWRLLTYACLRHRGELRRLSKRFLKREPSGRGRAVVTIVQIGLAQVLFTDVPPYAVVDATVELCRRARLGGFTKLVNAIMRRAIDEASAAIGKLDAARLNTPEWLWRAWLDAYGEQTARAIAAAHLSEPPLDLCVADPGSTAHWAETLGGMVVGEASVRLWPQGPIGELAGFADGAWWVQDAAAALPVMLLGDVRGRRVADLCAAPGGKTLQLAARGAVVSAVDRSAARLKRLRQNLSRTGLAAEIETADALTWTPQRRPDAVLLDAPCSATGTIRRNPDIPWIRDDRDVGKLAALQGRLLRHAIDIVKPGGLVVYCTCSLQPEEGERQVEAVLSDGLPAERETLASADLGPFPAAGEAITAAGDLRTLPGMMPDRGGLDGFYAARLRKRA